MNYSWQYALSQIEKNRDILNSTHHVPYTIDPFSASLS